jgi:antitoxin component of RelBE/YafQ-DinJ toxin-antitoxin module
MARSAPISIRLDAETQAELERMSAETGIPMSSLARMAIEAALKAYRENGQRIEVPFRFRTVRYPTPEDPPSEMVAEDPV